MASNGNKFIHLLSLAILFEFDFSLFDFFFFVRFLFLFSSASLELGEQIANGESPDLDCIVLPMGSW